MAFRKSRTLGGKGGRRTKRCKDGRRTKRGGVSPIEIDVKTAADTPAKNYLSILIPSYSSN